MTGKVTESIYDGNITVIPLAEVLFIQKREFGIQVVMKGTTYNVECDDYNNSVWIHKDEANDFMEAWCRYRGELEDKLERLAWERTKGDREITYDTKQDGASEGQSASKAMLATEVRLGQYQCEMCLGVFDFGWTEEEAKKEAEDNGFDINLCGSVCDDCYNKTPWGIAAQVGKGG